MKVEDRYTIKHTSISLEAIGRRPQMRKTFDEERIGQLAENIFRHGLRYSLSVADTADGIVLISGERRYRACQKLAAEGRFSDKVSVAIFYNLSDIAFAFLQASENIHEEVPPQEAAQFYATSWKMVKIAEPTFTLKDFAEAMGKGEGTIRTALKFCLLPDDIQNLVGQGHISYGIAVQLARLEEFVDAEELMRWAIHCVAANDRVLAVKERVSNFIQDQKSGQLSMMDIFSAETLQELEHASRRMTLDRTSTMAFWSMVQYLARIISLIEAGKIGLEDSPFSMKSPLKAFRRLVYNLERLLPHLRSLLPLAEYDSAKTTLQEAQDIAEQLEVKI